MKLFKLPLLLGMLFLVVACRDSGELMQETETTVSYYDMMDDKFVIRGTLDGVPFEIGHGDEDGLNSPRNDDDLSHVSPIPELSFGTTFHTGADGTRDTWLTFGLTREFNDMGVEELFKVGTYSWWDLFSDPKERGLAYCAIFNDSFFGSTTLQDQNAFFEITSTTLLEVGEEFKSEVKGNLYKVEGRFELEILDEFAIKVDYFSAIFLNKI